MITIRRTETTITVTGHSTEEGEERTWASTQACSAVTALTQALLFGIRDELQENAPYDIEKGNFYLETSSLSGEGKLLAAVFIRTATALAGAYPKYITVEA
jgi:uncharacterized protein YsxB (DUF464 family)